MVEFNVVVGDPKSGKCYPVQVSGQHANVLVRKRIGEEIDGMFLGLPGYKVTLTGGTDKDGFPMRPEIPQASRKRILVSYSIGFRPKDGGVRKKKTFRGNEISPDITQINCKITKQGPKKVEQLLGVAGGDDGGDAGSEADDTAAPAEAAEGAADDAADEGADEAKDES